MAILAGQAAGSVEVVDNVRSLQHDLHVVFAPVPVIPVAAVDLHDAAYELQITENPVAGLELAENLEVITKRRSIQCGFHDDIVVIVVGGARIGHLDQLLSLCVVLTGCFQSPRKWLINTPLISKPHKILHF